MRIVTAKFGFPLKRLRNNFIKQIRLAEGQTVFVLCGNKFFEKILKFFQKSIDFFEMWCYNTYKSDR